MLEKEDILNEIEAWRRAATIPKDENTKHEISYLMSNEDQIHRRHMGISGHAIAILGIFVTMVLKLLLYMCKILHFQTGAILLAKLRIAVDRVSVEPVSCGLNATYTHMGIAMLKKGNITGAIECLDASWKVHPCAHNTTFGLSTSLANALSSHDEAKESVATYREMYREFQSVMNYHPR